MIKVGSKSSESPSDFNFKFDEDKTDVAPLSHVDNGTDSSKPADDIDKVNLMRVLDEDELFFDTDGESNVSILMLLRMTNTPIQSKGSSTTRCVTRL